MPVPAVPLAVLPSFFQVPDPEKAGRLTPKPLLTVVLFTVTGTWAVANVEQETIKATMSWDVFMENGVSGWILYLREKFCGFGFQLFWCQLGELADGLPWIPSLENDMIAQLADIWTR